MEHLDTSANGFATFSDFESLDSDFSNSNSFSQNSSVTNGIGKEILDFENLDGNPSNLTLKAPVSSYGNNLPSNGGTFSNHSNFSESAAPNRNVKNDYGGDFHASMQNALYDNGDSLDFIIGATDSNPRSVQNINQLKKEPAGFDMNEITGNFRPLQSPTCSTNQEYRPALTDSKDAPYMNGYNTNCLNFDPLDISNTSMNLDASFAKNDLFDFDVHGPCNVSQNGQCAAGSSLKVEHPLQCGDNFPASISMNTFSYPVSGNKNQLLGYNFNEPSMSTANDNSPGHMKVDSYGGSYSESPCASQNYLANNFQNIYTNTFLNDPTCDFATNDQPSPYPLTNDQEHNVCGVCNKAFDSDATLRQHLTTHNGNQSMGYGAESCSKEKPFACDVCGKRFKLEDGLHNHRLNHKSDTPDTCHICGKVYTQANRLEKHLLSHTTGSPYICDVCGAAFRQQGLLKSHKLTHAGETSYPCNVCGVAFNQEASLEKHAKTHHIIMEGPSMKKPYVCGVCGKRFKREAGLLKHRSSHKGDKPDKCHICGKIYTQANRLEKHLLKHATNRPYICDVCGIGFQQPGLLNSHKQMHEMESPCVCNICGKAFSQKLNLDQHTRLMHSDKNFNPVFQCSVCEHRFSDRISLEKHSQLHTTGDGLYSCDVCGRKFSYGSSLEAHKRTHINDRQLRCDVCNHTFADVRSLSKHVRQHIPNETCDKSFVPKYEFIENELKPAMEQLFTCETCGKQLPSKLELAHHSRLHSAAGRPMKCYVCGDEFGSEGELTRHFVMHSNNMDFDNNLMYSDNRLLQDHKV